MSVASRAGRWTLRGIGALGVLFGLLTLVEGGSILFGAPEAVAAAGAYVPFVLWFNFLAGFAYVVAGVALLAGRRWARHLALAIAAATLLVFAAFGVHIALGGAFEARTVGAMVLRSGFWVLAAAIAAGVLRGTTGRAS